MRIGRKYIFSNCYDGPKLKYTPLEIRDQVLDDLYQKIDSRWKYELKIEKEMRGRALAKIIPNFVMRLSVKLWSDTRIYLYKRVEPFIFYLIIYNWLMKILREHGVKLTILSIQ